MSKQKLSPWAIKSSEALINSWHAMCSLPLVTITKHDKLSIPARGHFTMMRITNLPFEIAGYSRIF